MITYAFVFSLFQEIKENELFWRIASLQIFSCNPPSEQDILESLGNLDLKFLTT